ncbi:MAG: 4Fe-4S binding protein, partial [Selenomonadales bacterium]|nr:4Fe-4S binding protein [Selenomonadales bacterium]
SAYPYNRIEGTGTVGIVTGGVSAAYTKDALADLGADVRVLTIATPYPLPEPLAEKFLASVERVLVIEELDPVLEDALLLLAGKKHINIEICGKHTGHTITAGENSHTLVRSQIANFLGIEAPAVPTLGEGAPQLPVRPPTLCAGCPHRASFYAVKEAMNGRPAVFSGDIGCYTLGNAAPLHMVDTCLCMGAAISMPQGIARTGHDAVHFGFVGDSTFFHSGITNVINAVYNNMDEVVVILDNSTTAMTGHQPHPGIGRTMMGDVSAKISIEKVLEAVGVTSIRIVDPLDLPRAKQAVSEAAEEKGVRVIIFRSPCIALFKGEHTRQTNYNCIGCQTCIKEIGCPALSMKNDRCVIDTSLCNGCGLCEHVCPCQAIEEVK